MTTATQQYIEQQEAEQLQRMIEAFLQNWQPLDGDRYRFESDFLMVVRAIHRDAARPFQHTLSAALATMPLGPFPPRPTKEPGR